MAKKAAVLAVDPVNGSGLFQYLEAFYENGISYKTFAVSDSNQISTNSGIAITLDDVIANLKGHEDEYDALVFACGDAVPKFKENSDKQYNKDLAEVLKTFDAKGKIMAGHCAMGLLYDNLEIGRDKKLAVHPYIVPAINSNIATGEKFEIDSGIYTAQTESSIWMFLPELIESLKK